MNKLPIFVLMTIVIINIYLYINAAHNCLDNSWHMTKRYDSKEYHKVQCNCPCWKYKELPDRNKCSKCFHYHKPEGNFGVRKPQFPVAKMAEIYPKRLKKMALTKKQSKAVASTTKGSAVATNKQ